MDTLLTEVIDTSPDYIIEYTQRARLNLLENEKDPKFKLTVLNSLSKTAIDSKKLVMDNDNAVADREIAKSIFKAIGNIKENPFKSNFTINVSVAEPNIPTVIPLPDEDSTVHKELRYSDIINQ